jgi:hypothetical protein
MSTPCRGGEIDLDRALQAVECEAPAADAPPSSHQLAVSVQQMGDFGGRRADYELTLTNATAQPLPVTFAVPVDDSCQGWPCSTAGFRWALRQPGMVVAHRADITSRKKYFRVVLDPGGRARARVIVNTHGLPDGRQELLVSVPAAGVPPAVAEIFVLP